MSQETQILQDSKDNSSLKTEEILSILSKTKKSFKKESDISSKISNNFTKHNLTVIAKKNEPEKKSNENKFDKNTSNENVKESKNQKKLDILEKKEEEPKKEPPVSKISIKKYTEEQAQKMANELAKKYYRSGYNLGIKKIKDELQNGEQALALTLKNTIDNLFLVTPELSKEITRNLNKKIYDICQQIIGYEIKNKPQEFLKKIEELSNSLGESFTKAKVYTNASDNKIILDHLAKTKPDSNLSFVINNELKTGDIIIKSGGIEIKEIISEKIKLASHENLDNEIANISLQNEEIISEKKNKN